MSEQVTYMGNITKIECENALEKYKEIISEEIDITNMDEDDIYDKMYDDEKYIIINKDLYKINQLIDKECEDIYYAKKQNDGSYDIMVSFYNGCCSLSEAIEEAIRRNKKE